MVGILWSGLEMAHFGWNRVAAAGSAGGHCADAKERARIVAASSGAAALGGHGGDVNDDVNERDRIVIAQPLVKLDGEHLKVTLVEVNYEPGGASMPHSHPCPVIGYVVEGEIRSQVKGGPEKIYKAGESFYEPANGVHQVSANASATKPAKLVAYFVCDRDVALSVDVPHGEGPGGGAK